MKNTKLALLSAAAAIVLSNSAMAQQQGKYYGSLHGEFVVYSDSDVDLTSTATNMSGGADYDPGFGIGGAVGYNLTDQIRVEGELAYRETDVDSVSLGGTTVSGGNLELEIWSGMVNTYYNIPLDDKVSPYLGAGIGAAYNDNVEEFAFAYQAMAGVDFKVDEQGTLYGGYRYFGTTEFEENFSDAVLGNVTTKTDVSQHIVEVGYRFTF